MKNRKMLLLALFPMVLIFSLILPASIVAADETVTEDWVARYDCQDKGADFAEAIALDGLGNVYVTGTSQGDFATVKYDSAGNQLWATRYDGPVSYSWFLEDDKAKAIAVDNSGNVYVTGESMGQGTGWDYATVKYNANGSQLWVARYDGVPLPINDSANDDAEAIAVDASGNIYVTGTSAGDYVTIKYNSTGNQTWVARYDTPYDYYNYDFVRAMTIDESGNIYVTGGSGGIDTNSDYVTVKYDNAGNELWVARYDNGGYEYPEAIAIDNLGNVYVTGHCGGDGYGTVKYDSAGNQLWVVYHSTYNISEAYAIAVDSVGNVYVTGKDQVGGTGYEDYDYATIKYDSAGNQTWVRNYDGPANGADLAYALALDAANNVYVAGVSEGMGTFSDYAVVKYNSMGDELWVARYNGPSSFNDEAHSTAIDASGNVYVTGFAFTSSKQDYTTVKYDATGSQLWSAHYDAGVGGQEEARDMVMDSSGNIYVTGQSQGDYATVKYDNAGNQLWIARYDGPAHDDNQDSGCAIALDGLGNTYVTGYSEGIGTWHDCTTIKYDSSGNELWVARYNNPTGASADRGYAIAVDGSGNIYVAGEDWTEAGYHCVTIKYDNAGSQLWVQRYSSPGSCAVDMEVDNSGDIYVCAYSHVADSDWSYLIIKYDTAGNELWFARYDSSIKVWDWARAMVVDNSGNVYVTGTSGYGMVPGSENDYVTVKFDSEGNQLWAARYDSGGEDDTRNIAVDGSGNVYVTGFGCYTWVSEGMEIAGGDYATVKYDSAGNELWVRSYDGPAGGSDSGQAVTLDDIGNIYVTGSSWVSGTYEDLDTDYVTIKYDSAGNQLWMACYDGGANGFDAAGIIVLDGSGNVYVTGTSWGSGTYGDYATVKYMQTIEPGGCFIATAAYGTPMAHEVQILRDFRDGYLLPNPVGQAFVNFYYTLSPPIAEFMTDHPSLKPMVRVGLVPAVAVSTILVNTTTAEKIAIIGLLVLVSVALAVWVTRRRGRGPEYI